MSNNVEKTEQDLKKSSDSGLVRWLYPGAPNQESSSTATMATTENQLPSPDQSATNEDDVGEEMQAKTSSSSATTTGGPDSDVGSVDELPVDGGAENGKRQPTDELSEKMTAGANMLGSFISSAWTKTAKTANDATVNGSSFFSSAFSKVTTGDEFQELSLDSLDLSSSAATTKTSPKEELAPTHDGQKDESNGTDQNTTDEAIKESGPGVGEKTSLYASNLFSSAMNTFGFKGASAAAAEGEEKKEGEGDAEVVVDGSEKKLLGGFGSAFASLGTMAADARQTLKDKVVSNSILSEFNKEQENFIKSKGASADAGVAPWIGYQGEEELKAKILSLSQDNRNFIRAPPSGVTFDFDYASVAPTAMALLQEDPNLQKKRFELVPKTVKEEEFWRNYFYRVSLIKQSFELNDMERAEEVSKETKAEVEAPALAHNTTDEVEMSHDHDDEFVSDTYQASTKDIAEVDETMKKLGVTDDIEAELEGELNEYEVVRDDNGEWESQIDEMLEAEENNLK